MSMTTRRDFLRYGWKLGGALLAVAAGWTVVRVAAPAAPARRAAPIKLGNAGRLRRRHRHLRPRGAPVRRPTPATTCSPSRRSARTSAAGCRSASRRAASSAPATGRSSTSAASGSRARRRVAWTSYADRHDGDDLVRRHVQGRSPARPRGRHSTSRRPRARAASEGLIRCLANARPPAVRARGARAQPRPLPHRPGSSSWRCSSPASSPTRCASPRCGPTRKSDQQTRVHGDRHEAVRDNCASCHGKGGDGGSAPVLERQGVPEVDDRRPDPTSIVRSACPAPTWPRMEPGLRGHAHRRADRAAHHLPALAGGRTPRACPIGAEARLADGAGADR